MIIFPTNTDKLEWNSDDAKFLRDTLETPSFQKALAFVIAEKPALLDGSHMNKTLVASGVVKGFEFCLETLFKLTQEQPQTGVTHENYPDLDNESKWAGTDAR